MDNIGTKFKTVLLDPPWNERGGGKIKRGADKHYPLLSTPDIIKTIYQCEHWNNVHNVAHMYLWVTNKFLQDGLQVMSALGFRYVTNFVWVKDRIGLGQYFRGQHEICLLGTRGLGAAKLRTNRKNLPSVLLAPRSAHSSKPDESFDLIENRSEGPYLEIFSRQKRKNWIVWGNEIIKNQ